MQELRKLAADHQGSVLPDISKDLLHKVEILVPDPTKPITSSNAQVMLDGKLLGMVKSFNLGLDTEKPLGIVTLELYADYTVRPMTDADRPEQPQPQ